MRPPTVIVALCLAAIGLAGPLATAAVAQTPLQKQNERLFEKMAMVFGLTDAQMAKIRSIFARSGYIGQGNPAITVHPVMPAACLAKLEQKSISYENARFEKICGSKYMAPLYDPATQKPEDAKACIDQFEFPDIPCTYPVVWVKAREAAEICEAEGKRMCDAHEWEGACAGSLQPPDYNFDLAKGVSPSMAVNRMRAAHNRKYAPTKSWSYGPAYRRGACAAASSKSPKCNGGNWAHCGSNTYPTGDFPACHSPLDVYDLNGNAAEHMKSSASSGRNGEPRQQETGLHGDERQLVHLRQVPCASGLVPLARALLAWQPRDGSRQPRQLPSGLPLLQDPGRPLRRTRRHGCLRVNVTRLRDPIAGGLQKRSQAAAHPLRGSSGPGTPGAYRLW